MSGVSEKVKQAALELYKGAGPEALQDLSIDEIQNELTPYIQANMLNTSSSESHFTSHDAPHMKTAMAFIGAGVWKAEHAKEVLEGTPMGQGIVVKTEALMQKAGMEVPDLTGDGKFRVDDVKVDNPYLRQQLLDHTADFQALYQKHGGDVNAAWEEATAEGGLIRNIAEGLAENLKTGVETAIYTAIGQKADGAEINQAAPPVDPPQDTLPKFGQ